MKKAYKIRLYPTDAQKELIEKHFGCTRFIYNWALDQKNNYYKETGNNLSKYDLDKKITHELKKEYPWLSEVNRSSLYHSLNNLDDAFTRFFKYGTGYPNFKSKFGKNSFKIPANNRIDFDKNRLYIGKFQEGIEFRGLNKLDGNLKSVTISRRADRYFAALSLDVPGEFPEKPPIRSDKIIGIDVGISDFCTLSTGDKIVNPKFSYSELDKRKRILQKRCAKKEKGSRRYKLLKNQIAKIDMKISDQRKDFLHKLSHELTNGNGYTTIAVENLNVQGMMQNKHLSRSIADASWYSFYAMLQYKCDWYGKNFIKIGRFDPSSKTCSYCGYINKDLKLSQRSWTCPKCDTIHDRDINAALNIKEFALKNTPMESREEPVEPCSVEQATKRGRLIT